MRLNEARPDRAGPKFPLYRHMGATKRPTCRLMGPLKPFRACGIWSKDHPRARDNLASAHDPPKCARFGVKIMRSFINCERDRTQNRLPLLLIALCLRDARHARPFFV